MSNKCVLCYWYLNNKIRSDEIGMGYKTLNCETKEIRKKKNKLVLPNTKEKSPNRNEG